jgi:phospholipase C
MTSVEKFRACSAAVLIGLISVFCGCQGLPSAVTNPPPPPPNNASINSINHIVFMAQENRSFDTYFGQLQAYWQAN